MPNHVHGIIEIAKSNENINVDFKNTDKPKNRFGPQSQNLASIIRGFKIGATKNARLIHPDFQWQPRFYDHIIRDDRSTKFGIHQTWI